LQIKILTNLFH